ncbi:ectoine/hydroxyectoine ABC transporter permease subunit EhuC [Mesorhizobium tianshanense]|uniref:Amino acid ABC transporter membrane protein 1 (PAAT family) n=1 Tax=Mesorhizobium tianshanense TaxID=39844 RepID=A0A562N3W2_9HYPH|nr:ectoine/hydroxyectoine ABC transporter permease subunit EhuC [Mesorhizobium tianshanense]TWI26773.1 amino acid ABC transporter membrane protein 1 (PAAT family) [Mesorhizobium tianshanense]GLS36341.1 ectoine/hydroxyectoine ABC transporter permease subunit EhuC [Mesorhizobium tianshanense]
MTALLDLLPQLMKGLQTTLLVTAFAAPLALVMALASGLARLSPIKLLQWLAVIYVELFRGTSLLVQLFYFFYVMPLFGLSLDPVTTGVLVLALNTGAYGSEVVRAGIGSVPKSQREACIALNMSPAMALRRVIFPQAFVTMLPPFGNLLIELLKATSLLSLITIFDLAFAGNTLFQTTGRTLEIYGLVLMIYFATAMVLTLGMRWLEKRMGAGRDLEFRP